MLMASLPSVAGRVRPPETGALLAYPSSVRLYRIMAFSATPSSDSDAEEAITALRLAIQDGFGNAYLMRTDPRLDGLRSRPGSSFQSGTARRSIGGLKADRPESTIKASSSPQWEATL
jgi:hypothetical protein